MTEIDFRKNPFIHSRLQTHNFPLSTETELFLQCRPSLFGYKRLLRWPGLQIPDFSLCQINETIRKVNKIVDLALIDKKTDNEIDFQETNMFLIKLFGLIAILIALVMYLVILYDIPNFKDYYIFVPALCIFAVLFFALLVMIRGLMSVRPVMDYDCLIEKAIDSVLEREQEYIYKPKGWHIQRRQDLLCLKIWKNKTETKD